jgi:hypothetical protein
MFDDRAAQTDERILGRAMDAVGRLTLVELRNGRRTPRLLEHLLDVMRAQEGGLRGQAGLPRSRGSRAMSSRSAIRRLTRSARGSPRDRDPSAELSGLMLPPGSSCATRTRDEPTVAPGVTTPPQPGARSLNQRLGGYDYVPRELEPMLDELGYAVRGRR